MKLPPEMIKRTRARAQAGKMAGDWTKYDGKKEVDGAGPLSRAESQHILISAQRRRTVRHDEKRSILPTFSAFRPQHLLFCLAFGRAIKKKKTLMRCFSRLLLSENHAPFVSPSSLSFQRFGITKLMRFLFLFGRFSNSLLLYTHTLSLH